MELFVWIGLLLIVLVVSFGVLVSSWPVPDTRFDDGDGQRLTDMVEWVPPQNVVPFRDYEGAIRFHDNVVEGPYHYKGFGPGVFVSPRK